MIRLSPLLVIRPARRAYHQDDVSLLAFYQAALNEDCLKLKLCEVSNVKIPPAQLHDSLLTPARPPFPLPSTGPPGSMRVPAGSRSRQPTAQAPLPRHGQLEGGGVGKGGWVGSASRRTHACVCACMSPSSSVRLQPGLLFLTPSPSFLTAQAGLRTACIAAALGLNTTLRTLDLGGWTWDELGNGCALPFLTLGCHPGAALSCVKV